MRTKTLQTSTSEKQATRHILSFQEFVCKWLFVDRRLPLPTRCITSGVVYLLRNCTYLENGSSSYQCCILGTFVWGWYNCEVHSAHSCPVTFKLTSSTTPLRKTTRFSLDDDSSKSVYDVKFKAKLLNLLPVTTRERFAFETITNLVASKRQLKEPKEFTKTSRTWKERRNDANSESNPPHTSE